MLGSSVALGGMGTLLLQTRRVFGQAAGSDVDVLNIALSFEHLEVAFYRDQLARFTPKQFRRRFDTFDGTIRNMQRRSAREIAINQGGQVPRAIRPINPSSGNVRTPTNNVVNPTNNIISPTNNLGNGRILLTNNLVDTGLIGGNGVLGATNAIVGGSIGDIGGALTNVGSDIVSVGDSISGADVIPVGATVSPFDGTVSPIGSTTSPFGSTVSPIGSTVSPMSSPFTPVGTVNPSSGSTVGANNNNVAGTTNQVGNGSNVGNTNNVGGTNGTGNASGAIGASSVLDLLTDVRDQEAAHVQSLTETITSLGGTPVQELQYNFGVDSLPEFISLAQTFENLGVSAYDEILGLLVTPDLRRQAAGIATVEARHAAFLNLARGAHPFPQAIDTPRSLNDVMATLTPFVVG